MVLQKGTDRDVEAQLMHLLDFEHFELVRELLKNRFTIVWCTRLQRAQADDERQRIEASLPALMTTLDIFPFSAAVDVYYPKTMTVSNLHRTL